MKKFRENGTKENLKRLKESREKYKTAFERSEFYKNLFIHDIGNILNIINLSADLYLNKQISLNENLLLTQKAIERGKKLMINVVTLSQINESEIVLEEIDIFRE